MTETQVPHLLLVLELAELAAADAAHVVATDAVADPVVLQTLGLLVALQHLAYVLQKRESRTPSFLRGKSCRTPGGGGDPRGIGSIAFT